MGLFHPARGSCLSFPTCPPRGGLAPGASATRFGLAGWGGEVFIALADPSLSPPPQVFEQRRWPGSKLLHLTSALVASALPLRLAPAQGFTEPPPNPKCRGTSAVGRDPPWHPEGCPRHGRESRSHHRRGWQRLPGPCRRLWGGGKAGGRHGVQWGGWVPAGLLSPGWRSQDWIFGGMPGLPIWLWQRGPGFSHRIRPPRWQLVPSPSGHDERRGSCRSVLPPSLLVSVASRQAKAVSPTPSFPSALPALPQLPKQLPLG